MIVIFGDCVKTLLSLVVLIASMIASAETVEEFVSTKTPEIDQAKIAEFQKRCENISSLVVKKAFKLDCFTNYNHYGPTSKKFPATSGNVKIANYNLLHPGTSKALFKDYALVAKIMNRYDIVAGLELLATVGHDEQNNKAVLAFLGSAPETLSKLLEEKASTTGFVRLQELNSRIDRLSNNIQKAYDLYRSPGYYKVLEELKKLDPSWSLILSPRGDSALSGSVEELVGFYYRASVATPAVNPHCKEVMGVGAGSPVACFISLDKKFMGKDLLQHFARRPFMASFKVGSDKLTLVTSHVVFTYSGNEALEKDLMMKTFGVENYKDLGKGINTSNFARYAEVKNTLDFMNRYRKKYNDRKIMFLADMNLVSNNAFWPEVLKALPGSEVLNDEGSTLSPARYTAKGEETNGVANDYDHFIMQTDDFSACSGTDVYNYYEEGIYGDIENRYVIREEVAGLSGDLLTRTNVRWNEIKAPLEGDVPEDDVEDVDYDYPLTSAGRAKMDKFTASTSRYLKGLYTIKRNEIVPDDFQIKERLDGLRKRVFLRQLTNPYYYRFMQEVLSDHFPVSISCKF